MGLNRKYSSARSTLSASPRAPFIRSAAPWEVGDDCGIPLRCSFATRLLSIHLAHFQHARLIRFRRNGRYIIYNIYSAVIQPWPGHPAICAPAVAALACSCGPSLTESA